MLYALCCFWRMKMILKDRVALVTGASRGIGAATAEVLAVRGTRVAVCARTLSDLERLATRIKEGGGQTLALSCDVLDLAQIEGTIRRVIE
jgi:NAD(P)-dependent dehydrogenase (short-subunit alcohol dehydrogenase family)